MHVEYAPQRHQGVTQLAYVSGFGQDEPATSNHPAWTAIRNGLVVMGLATLIGLSPRTARWAGVVGVGYTLVKK